MKHYEHKVSYSVVFEIGPQYDRDPGLFLEAMVRFMADHFGQDPQVAFIDAEFADEAREAVQVNLLVAFPDEMPEYFRKLLRGGGGFTAFRYWQDLARAHDSRGRQLYPKPPSPD